jgi:hypothetical protein
VFQTVVQVCRYLALQGEQEEKDEHNS